MAGMRLLRSTILSRQVLAPLRRQLSVATRSLSMKSDNEKFQGGEGNLPPAYHRFLRNKEIELQARLQDPGRFQHISEREERSIISPDIFRAIVAGKYLCSYRGMDMMKTPADMAVLTQLFWHVRPRTVFELGTFTGASAVWMADMLKLSEVDCNIYSVDRDISLLQTRTKELKPSNVTFFEGECEKVETVFPADFLAKQPHPWIVIDDAHDGIEAVLGHFHHYLTPGDYFVCEDTNPSVPNASIAGVVQEDSEDWGLRKLYAWKRFLTEHGDKYAIDTFFTDLLGYNSTSNWDGYARCMK